MNTFYWFCLSKHGKYIHVLDNPNIEIFLFQNGFIEKDRLIVITDRHLFNANFEYSMSGILKAGSSMHLLLWCPQVDGF